MGSVIRSAKPRRIVDEESESIVGVGGMKWLDQRGSSPRVRCLGSPPRIRNLGLPKYDREDGSSFDLAKWIRSLSRYQNPGVGAGSSGSSELLKQLELGE